MKRFRRVLVWFAAAVGACVLVVVLFGSGGKSQFNPVTFERRGMTTFSIPYTDVVVWSHPGSPWRPQIVKFWIEAGYANPDSAGGPWHTVTGHTAWSRQHGPAKPLWYHADCENGEGADAWIAWSLRHPALAADLWPRVISLLQQAGHESPPSDYYRAAALLMAYVQRSEDENAYRQRVADWQHELANDYPELCTPNR